VTSEVKQLARRLADSMGISLSEYVRQLVVADIDGRNIFTDDVKRKISSEAPKADVPNNQLRSSTS